MIYRDLFTGVTLCSSPDCHWEVPGGWSGIEARYADDHGRPACYEHRLQEYDEPVSAPDG